MLIQLHFREKQWHINGMRTFKSVHSYRSFESTVKSHSRYFYDDELEDFFQIILETSKTRVDNILKGTILWRSQIGNDWEPYCEGKEHVADVECPLDNGRMKPTANVAHEGRANPKGIPYLYLSTDMDTSMAEVRPWIGSYISAGQFKILKDISFVNCTSDDKRSMVYLKEPDSKEKEIAVWRDIDRAFSRPITRNENAADYIPTQILAELFKKNGFDGIAYRSSLGKGHNFALFDLNAADIINCTLFEVKKVSFDFSQSSNTYFVSKYYQESTKLTK